MKKYLCDPIAILPITSDGAGTLGVLTGKMGVPGRDREAKNLSGFSGLMRWDSNFARPLATAPFGILIPLMSCLSTAPVPAAARPSDLSLFTWLPMIVRSLLEEEKMFVTLSITVPLVMPILPFPSCTQKKQLVLHHNMMFKCPYMSETILSFHVFSKGRHVHAKRRYFQ